MTLLRTRIDLGALAHNTRTIAEKIGDARLMAVVKADAYNHGVEQIVPVLEEHGAGAFGVATLPEARVIRRMTDAPVLAWIWQPGTEIEEALSLNISLGVPSLAHIRALIEVGLPAKVSVMVETGLHRSGIDEADWDEAFALLAESPNITVSGLSSHLASADDLDNPATAQQREVFERAIARGRAAGLELPLNHLANSAGALLHDDLRYEQARVGIALYGCGAGVEETGLKPAMSWVADTLVVKQVAAGESVSYDHTWTAPEDGYTAMIPVGYADGLPRAAQGKIEIGISGRRYPQVGRVCMDQIVVWLGDNPYGVVAGDEAVIFGDGGMSVAEFAAALDTIDYEVLCLPKGRTIREYEQ